MSNLMDYLDWRGDLTFREAPFNEVDNLILAQLVYVEFAGIVPAPGEEGTITVKEACELFFETHDRKEIMERVSMTKTAAFVLEKMAQTERFCNAQLFGYINDISKAAAMVAPIYKDANSLYKSPFDNHYYLIVNNQSDNIENYQRACNLLSEYGTKVKANYAMPYYFSEHFKLIIKNDAIRTLASI